MGSLVELWFGFKTPVGRRAYATTGFLLAGIKFLGDFTLIWLFTGRTWSPLSYLNPYFMEEVIGRTEADSEVFALVLWTIPFLWIGASMTFRRLIDAGLPPFLGALFFVPILNYLTMLLLCGLPSQADREETQPEDAPADRDDTPQENAEDEDSPTRFFPYDDFIGATFGAIAGVFCVLLAFNLGNYGAGLFLGTPFLVGVVVGWVMNQRVRYSEGHTFGIVLLTIMVCLFGLLFLAFEGLICLVMAFPLIGFVAGIGGLLGRELGQLTSTRLVHFTLLFLAIPVLTGIESYEQTPPIRQIVTSIEVDAPVSVVWDNVISFPPLPPPHEWIFKLGVACPERAFIVGEGEGALRYCVFTTGTFVEPITTWDPPNRLAFDVTEQPPNMKELSPYDSVNPDHLLEGVVSHQGEFRIIQLENGKTLLEGRTFYSLNFKPQFYWGWWSDNMIHTIHYRVLNHIKSLSEDAATAEEETVTAD